MRILFSLAALNLLVTPSPVSQAEDLSPLRKSLTGEDAKKVEGLEKEIEKLVGAGKLAEALSAAKEVEPIRIRIQGKDHWEALDASWRVRTLAAALGRSPEEQTECQSLRSRELEAEELYKKGLYAEAQPLYEESLALRKKLLGEEHPQTATGYNKLAVNLNIQRKYAEAQSLFEKALALTKKLLGEEHPKTAENYIRLASNLGDQGKYAEAQPLFEKALALRKKLLGEEHTDTASGYNHLAKNLGDQGKYAEAQPLFEKALAIWKKLLGEEHPDTARSYNNLAWNFGSRGKYAEAQPLFEKALALWKKLLGEDHPDTAMGYNNLAVNLSVQGKYAEAQPLFEKALALRKKILGEDHPDTAMGYNNLAGNLNAQGKYAEAQQRNEKALALWKKLLGEEHPQTAAGYSSLAFYLNAQEKYAEAQPLFEKALALSKKLLGEEHPQTASVYHNLAWNLDSQGKVAEAQPLHEKALALWKRLLGEEHPYMAAGYNNLAANLNAQGKHEEAIERWLLAARSFETARLHVSISGLGRAAFSAEQNPLPGLTSALVRDGRSLEAWRYFEMYLARGLLDDLSTRDSRKLTAKDREREQRLVGEIEGLEARLFRSGEGKARPEAAALEPLRQKRLELQAELSAFERHLADTYGVVEGKSYDLEKIQAGLPEDAALIGWLDVQGHGKAAELTSGRWAVVVRQKGEPRWVNLPGSSEGGRWTEEDDGLGARLAAELSDRRRLPRPLDRDLLARLSRQRLEAVEKVLSEDAASPLRRLIVLPSPALRDVPVALLTERYTVSYAPSGSVLAWLEERKRTVPLTKARSLFALGDPVFNKEDQKPPEGDGPPVQGAYLSMVVRGSNGEHSGLREGDVLLAYGGDRLQSSKDLAPAMRKVKGPESIPVTVWRKGKELEVKVSPGTLGVRLDERPPNEARKSERDFAMLLRGLRGANDAYEPLPGTRQEVEAIAGKFKGRVEKLLGADASEPKLRDLVASGKLAEYRYLHFATHGVPNRQRAFDSALILSHVPEEVESPGSSREAVDGRLTAGEILRSWSLNADLVVLSACQSAVGQHAGGEGYLGFAQALLLSGASAVVLSLWKVDDTATALLMERFYENVLGERPGMERGMAKAEALREAQSWLRALTREEVQDLAARQSALVARAEPGGKDRGTVRPLKPAAAPPRPAEGAEDRPYADPYFWAAFILIGDPE